MSTALCLIALCLGYIVYVNAVREKEGLRILGQVIGIVVMLAAVGGFLCSTMHRMKRDYDGGCMMGQKMNCPLSAAKMDMDKK